MKIQKNNLVEGIYVSGENSPYFKYFLAKEDETKQNLVMMYESIYRRNFMIASSVFLTFNGTNF